MVGSKSKELLEEENRKLNREVEKLREELSQRDALIATLEAQVKALVKEGTPSDQDLLDESSSKPGTWLPIHLPLGPSSSNLSKGRDVSDDDDDSSSTPTYMPSRYSSMDPPTRSQAPESVDNPPRKVERVFSENVSSRSHNGSESMASFVETVLTEPIAEEDDEEVDSHEDPENAFEAGARKKLAKSRGAIKGLPREMSIRNADDDDVTKYSVDIKSMPTIIVEAAEMRDAYNARGLYTGSISRKHQVPHGRGVMNYHIQGRSYEGDWVLGHWHGRGKIRNANGDVYDGPVRNDLRVGHGCLYYGDGRIFDGTFEDDDPTDGTLTFPDGARYVGELHNQARHGYGTYYFKDGSTYEGMSSMNSFQGKGKMTWPDGGWYEGEWMVSSARQQSDQLSQFD